MTKVPASAIPFYGGTPDATHCVQASVRMVLKYFLPDREFSWEELDEMSAKAKGKATWPAQLLISLVAMDFDIALIEGFDAQAFIKEGEGYLRRTFGDEAADWQVANSNIPAEQARYKELLASGIFYENRPPTFKDIRAYLERGYLVKCTVNSRQLNHQEGYVGHSVIVTDITDTHITIHDPGPPHKPNRTETLKHFESAWAYLSEDHKELIAFKYKG